MSIVVLTSLNKPIVKLSRLQMLLIVTYQVQEDGPPQVRLPQDSQALSF